MVKIETKSFSFKEGQTWDGDEAIIHFIEDTLVDWDNNIPKIRQNTLIDIRIKKE